MFNPPSGVQRAAESLQHCRIPFFVYFVYFVVPTSPRSKFCNNGLNSIKIGNHETHEIHETKSCEESVFFGVIQFDDHWAVSFQPLQVCSSTELSQECSGNLITRDVQFAELRHRPERRHPAVGHSDVEKMNSLEQVSSIEVIEHGPAQGVHLDFNST